MKKKLIGTIKIVGILYVIICALLYFFQERMIFFPQKLNMNHTFTFENSFQEVFINSDKNYQLHGLHFKADSSKGVIFYLHGNAGSLDS